MSNMRDICQIAPVIPVLVIQNSKVALELGQALVNGGLPVLEVTLRTSAALDVIKVMSSIPNAIVGAGTIVSPEDIIRAKEAGAVFGVSPGTTKAILKTAKEENFALLPGVATASEIMKLNEEGYDTLKFFPAEAAGGVSMLKSWSGPLPDTMFCPTGGISLDNAKKYLSLSNVPCVGGSWIVNEKSIMSNNWEEIRLIAEHTVKSLTH